MPYTPFYRSHKSIPSIQSIDTGIGSFQNPSRFLYSLCTYIYILYLEYIHMGVQYRVPVRSDRGREKASIYVYEVQHTNSALYVLDFVRHLVVYSYSTVATPSRDHFFFPAPQEISQYILRTVSVCTEYYGV